MPGATGGCTHLREKLICLGMGLQHLTPSVLHLTSQQSWGHGGAYFPELPKPTSNTFGQQTADAHLHTKEFVSIAKELACPLHQRQPTPSTPEITN